MNLNEIPLFSMLKSRLGYISQRERLIAQNVANADTAGYTPQDLQPFTLPKAGESGGVTTVRLERTNSSHLAGTGAGASAGGASWKPVPTPAPLERCVSSSPLMRPPGGQRPSSARPEWTCATRSSP